MKYINTKTLGVVVFDDSVQHVTMLQLLGLPREDVLGAGFVAIDADGVMVPCGSSVSLQVGTSDDCRRKLAVLSRGYA